MWDDFINIWESECNKHKAEFQNTKDAAIDFFMEEAEAQKKCSCHDCKRREAYYMMAAIAIQHI